MSHRSVFAALKATGIPFMHMAWPKDDAPALPWGVFLVDDDATFIADGERFCKAARWRVELYQKTRDRLVEQKVEQAIEQTFGPYRRGEQWVDDENCLMAVYEFTEIERN